MKEWSISTILEKKEFSILALLQMQFLSEAIGKQTSVSVLLPDDIQPPYKTLYLFHGWSDDHTAWMRHSAIEQYAKREQIAVIMPDVGLSYYTDMVYGGRYYTYISKELPARMEREFSLSTKREDRYVAGLSMGGFGALKWALNEPNLFAAAASFSGALIVEELVKIHEQTGNHARKPLMQAIFGKDLNVEATGGNLIKRIETQTKALPPLYQYCGTEDFVYDLNRLFRDQARSLHTNIHYQEGPGEHTWDYWDARIDEWLHQLRTDNLL